MAFPILKPSFRRERVFLVGIRRQGETARDFEASCQELDRLIDTAGGEVIGQTRQQIDIPNPRTFIGKGKVEEILAAVGTQAIDTVAIDDELTPAQNANLEMAWNVKVLDRTAVILDIFAKRAHTKEGRLQVELAQLEYIQPRLKGMWSHFSKQTGGIGTRGPGETQLEVDRRRVRERIAKLKERLEAVKTHRMIQRQKREAVPFPIFSIVGYTNAGKSTLFNALTRSKAFVEDKLFATLDPMVRRLKLPSGRQILLADTVGFIRKLPHTLVEAFKATFEEAAFSDGLIHLVDASDGEVYKHMQTVEQVLLELNLNHKPTLMVFNKIDRGIDCIGGNAAPTSLALGCGPHPPKPLVPGGSKSRLAHLNGYTGIPVSALTGQGVNLIVAEVDALLRRSLARVQFFLPHTKGDILAQLYRLGHIHSVRHQKTGIAVDCEIAEKFIHRFQPYLAKNGHSR